MIASMTGFSSVIRELPQGQLHLALRATNYRYLDIQVRSPEDFRLFEPMLRETIARHVKRGKVECRLAVNSLSESVSTIEIDDAYLKKIILLAKTVSQHDTTLRPLGIADLLHWPGVLRHKHLSHDALQELLIEALQSGLEQFNQSRFIEGEKIVSFLLAHIAKMEAIIVRIETMLPDALTSFKEKLAFRLKEAIGHADDDRIQQEFILFAQKIDVEEELERLNMHLSEIKRICSNGTASGKQLDFLMQELNREANTLASKSVSGKIIHESVVLKLLIEQMREQIQNVE